VILLVALVLISGIGSIVFWENVREQTAQALIMGPLGPAPKENCEQFYKEAQEYAGLIGMNNKQHTYNGNSRAQISIAYSLLYQNCTAHSKH